MGQEQREPRGLLATIKAFFGGVADPDEASHLARLDHLAPPTAAPTPVSTRAPQPPAPARQAIDQPTLPRPTMPPPQPIMYSAAPYGAPVQMPPRPAPPPVAGNSRHARPALAAETAPAYRQRADFLSPAEAAFFAVLREAVGADWHINSKVRLADLVDAPPGREWQAAWNKISRKHVDFVLCDPATMRPRVVIELDDRSHRRPDRIERDAFVDRVFADAALPILHIPVRRGYDPHALRGQIAAALGYPAPAAAPVEESRRCERCGAVMQRRTARRGDHAGATFWGCTNYPRCRHLIPIAA